jgi:hypothetical protein
VWGWVGWCICVCVCVCVCVCDDAIIRNRERTLSQFIPPPTYIHSAFNLSASTYIHTHAFIFRSPPLPVTPSLLSNTRATRLPRSAPFREIDCSIFPRVFLFPSHSHAFGGLILFILHGSFSTAAHTITISVNCLVSPITVHTHTHTHTYTRL